MSKEFNKHCQSEYKWCSLELVSESKTYNGGFGNYVLTNKVVEICFDANPSSLDEKGLQALIDELTELRGLMQ